MLTLKNIQKYYEIGGTKYWALKGVNLSFRPSEFVAILGQSGSGKTTMLNLIGGLDRYSEGDLIIDNVSTKLFKDKDWDAYRNHRIGFVFQNYNLIAHLDILSNVELALTLSGVSKAERKNKAKEALAKVGLIDHITKKPTQLSGGQQQRVAIARALVNDPNIILADEPTGALDSETSVEIMELLQSIAADKLIIMVTHNEHLAHQYAKRIVSLKDGLVTNDNDPYVIAEPEIKEVKQKTSMSYLTAISLSFKNLLTKKFRAIITAFAGSIGIIGVGLVLSLQYGFTAYLEEMERGTFAGLPITVSTTFMDIGAMMNPGIQIGDPIVDGDFAGRDPVIPEFLGTNIIDQEFIDFIEQHNISNYAEIIQVHDFNIFAFNLVNGNFLPTPTQPPPLPIPGINASPLIIQSRETQNMFDQFTRTLATYQGDAQFRAMLGLSADNTVPNAILEFLGLPTNTELYFNDVLGLTFRIVLNEGLWQQNGNVFSLLSNSQIQNNWATMSSDQYMTITITDVIQADSAFATVHNGIVLHVDTAAAIYAANHASSIAVAQRASTTSVIDTLSLIELGINPLNTALQSDILTAIGGSDTPDTILLHPLNFEAKESIMNIIDQYNDLMISQGREERTIHAVDNIAAALAMISTIMTAISAVLIAFAAISLVVSSIMIGIITYTSVLERTKEIGILRAIGARKKDVSRVFNAESILIGFSAGLMGVILTYALVPIVNVFLRQATDGSNVANLNIFHALLLVLISMTLTFVAGLLPSRIAAKKDPVVALRSE